MADAVRTAQAPFRAVFTLTDAHIFCSDAFNMAYKACYSYDKYDSEWKNLDNLETKSKQRIYFLSLICTKRRSICIKITLKIQSFRVTVLFASSTQLKWELRY